MTEPEETSGEQVAAISRRKMLGLLGAVPAAAVLASTRAGAALVGAQAGPRVGKPLATGGELNVYTWPNYFSPTLLQTFTQKTGINVNIATYSNNQVLYNALTSPAGAGYDIVIPSSSWIKEMSSQGLLRKLNHNKLKLSGLDSSLLGRNYDKDNTWSLPKDWGVLGVVYNPSAVGGTIKTWSDFYNYGAQPGVSGKVRMSNSAYETIGTELWIEDISWNTTKEYQIEAAAQKLISFARNVATFSSFQPASMANGSIVMAQTDQSGARRAIALNPSLEWVVPGPLSELWVDCFAITAHSPNLDAAYEFLNFQFQPDIQIAQTEFIGYPAALNNLKKKLPPTTPEVALIFGGAKLNFDKLTSYSVNPNTAALWSNLQAQIQAAS